MKVASDSRASPARHAAGGSRPGSITVVAATALGVGGMMGAGLYTLVGLASKSAGSFVPVAFVIAGIAALFSVYSYARLSLRSPVGAARRSSCWRSSAKGSSAAH